MYDVVALFIYEMLSKRNYVHFIFAVMSIFRVKIVAMMCWPKIYITLLFTAGQFTLNAYKIS